MEIGIHYGVMCEPFAKQLQGQNVKFNAETVKGFQDQLHAFHTLRFSDLITDSMADKIIAKLHKKIMAHVAKQNKSKVTKTK